MLTRRSLLKGLASTGIALAMPSLVRAQAPTDIRIGYYVPDLDQISSPSKLSWLAPANMVGMCLEPLVRIGGNNVLEYVLAKSITSDDTGKVWDIILKPNAIWRKRKSAVTAKDILANLKVWVDDSKSSVGQQLAAIVSDIQVVSPAQVRLFLKESNFHVLYIFTSYAALIMHPNDGWTFSSDADGTGPFSLNTYRASNEAVFQPVADYWNPSDHARAAITYLHDDGALDQNYDFIPLLDPQESLKVETVGLKIKQNQLADALVFHMACTTAPLDDPALRQALRLCVDPAAMVKSIGGFGRPSDSTHASSIHQDYPESWAGSSTFNPSQAKKLLAGRDIILPLHYPADNVWQQAAAQAFAEQAKAVGVSITLTPIQRDTFDDNWDTFPGLTIIKWQHRPLAMQLYDQVYRSTANWNLSKWHNDDFDQAVSAALATPVTERAETSGYISKAMAILQAEGPMIQPLWLDCNKAYNPATIIAESVQVGSGGFIYANRLERVA